MKPERLSIEGKWQNIRRMIQGLLEDGWTMASIEPNDTFTFTIVELTR